MGLFLAGGVVICGFVMVFFSFLLCLLWLFTFLVSCPVLCFSCCVWSFLNKVTLLLLQKKKMKDQQRHQESNFNNISLYFSIITLL